MENNDVYYLLLNGIIQTIRELEYDILECDGNYKIYYDTINNLLNIYEQNLYRLYDKDNKIYSTYKQGPR